MHRSGGFTLIEITLVMVIAGLLFAIALPNMGALSESLAYRGAVRDVMTAAQSARRQSARTGEPVDLLIYPELKALEVTGDLACWPFTLNLRTPKVSGQPMRRA